MKASDLMVKALEKEGVEYIFGIPGEENLSFLDSLSRSSIKLVLVRHEQAAGFMAATYGRLTGKAGVCLATLGPGATNLVTAAAYANLGAMPMVMITGQKPIKTSKQGQFQVVDVVDMMRPLTKFTRQIESGDRVPSSVREAFRKAQEERPGAAHLELPEDIAQEISDAPVLEPSFARRPAAEKNAVDRAVEMISGAKHPLLLIGAGANRNRTSKRLRHFVEQTGIPFVTTQMGKGVIDEESEHYIGTSALSSNDFVHRAIDAADVIVNVGHDVVEKPPFFMRSGGRSVIHINFTSAEVDPVYFPQVEVIGDIATNIQRIGDVLPKKCNRDYSFFRKVQEALSNQMRQDNDENRFPILPQRMVDEIRRLMPADGILALDNGMYKIWFARNYPANLPNTILLDNALAAMGAGLPSAIVAKMVHPERKIMAICGDGGFMMNSQELITAVQLKLDMVIVILCDNAFGMVKWKQKEMNLNDYGLDFTCPDFVKYAEACGATGHWAGSAPKFAAIVEEVLNMGGVHLIEVPIDYTDNHRILNQEIKELSEQL